MEDREELARLLALKISQAETLLEKLSAFPVLEGKTKLEKKISAELRFLRKVLSSDSCLDSVFTNPMNSREYFYRCRILIQNSSQTT